MKAPALALLLLLTACGTAPAAPPRQTLGPQRIVSLNLCADQLLLALADRTQVAALTSLAVDPAMSAGADQAQGWPASRGSAEDIVMLHPDLVIAAPGMRGAEVAASAGQRFATLDLPPAESFSEIDRQIRLVAKAVGHPERGEALVRHLAAQLAAMPRNASAGVAAHYQKRGWMTGGGTLVDEIMRRAGLVNLATRLGKPALAQVSLEEMVVAQPDWLIVDAASGAGGGDDQGAEMLRHPAIAAIPRLTLNGAATVCGGPATVAAATSLARQVAAHGHSANRTPASAVRRTPTTPNTSS